MAGQRRYPEIDRFKGILIALVVLGHNILFSEWSPRSFAVLYNFHVACFLLIPFLFHTEKLTLRWLADRATRYMVPHFLFFAVAALAYLVVLVPKTSADVFGWLQSVFLAVVLSSETTYNNAAGFRIFWFLPALLTLIALRAYYTYASPSGRYVIIGMVAAAHLGLGLAPKEWLVYVPWGLPIALFVFPVGIAAGWIWKYYNQSFVLRLSGAALFVLCIAVSVQWGSQIGLAGEPEVYSLLELERLIFHDVFFLSAFFGLLLAARLVQLSLLATLGAASLVILFTHGLVWQVLVRLGIVSWLQDMLPKEWISVMLSYVLTLAICLALYQCLRASPRLWASIFPHDWESWRRRHAVRPT